MHVILSSTPEARSHGSETDPDSRQHEWLLPAFLVVCVLGVSGFLLSSRRPLGLMEGFAEEYVALGYNLAATGSLSGHDLPPSVLRPPGYPFFIACVIEVYLLVSGGAPAELTEGIVYPLILWAQAALLAASALLLYTWLKRRVHGTIAFMAALTFGCNPYQQILVGFLHYETLHIALILSATSLFGICLERNESRRPILVLCGFLFGLATLTRPMTLILPPFILIACLGVRPLNVRLASLRAGLVCLGMLTTVAPYTVRNYVLTGRLIPVNAQAGANVWATTQKVLDRAPNRYRWWDVWYPDGDSVYTRISGTKGFNLPSYMKYVLPIEDELKRLAAQNLATRPKVYLQNVARNTETFLFDINSVLIGMFVANQQISHVSFTAVLGSRQLPEKPFRSWLTALCEASVRLLSLCALCGIVVGVRKRDPFVLAPLVVVACLGLAHAVIYMDMLYYYVKLPFLFLFAAYFLSVARAWHPARLGRYAFCRGMAHSIGVFLVLLFFLQLAGVLAA